MKLTLAEVRKMVLDEAQRIGASPEYMKKERVREELQSMIAQKIAAGEIADDKSLKDFLSGIDLAMTSLKMIPFDVWTKLAGKKPAKSSKR